MNRTAEATTDTGQASGLMRVASSKISHLMDLVSELSLSVAETLQSGDLEGLELPRFEASAQRLQQIVREVQDAATELRLVPVDDVFKRLRRMVRELERQTGKLVELDAEGADTMIDKVVADRLYDPLLHVLRNSVDHGLEPPSEREAAGKAQTGRIRLSASQVGSEVRILIADDGRGLNRARILKRARERGLFGPTDEPESERLWKVIFEPGFSTAENVSNLSGRGVGMDVLNQAMKTLRGRIGIDSTAGQGTTVSLHIPVSLAFLDCIILRLGACLYAIPIDDVAEILQPAGNPVTTIFAEGGAETLRARDRLVPLLRLERFFGAAPGPLPPVTDMVLLVVRNPAKPFAIAVNEVLDRQMVVMKPLAGTLARVRAGHGFALLGSGDVALVLDCEHLSRHGGPA